MKGAPLGNFCMGEARAGIDRKTLDNFVAGERAPVFVLLLGRVRGHECSPVLSH